jgi:ATP-dependent exoDNAse (exonuclease V) beta subunit
VRDYISYSELKLWNECTHRHKLKYVDGLEDFTGNLYTAFGSAIHSVCENIALKKDISGQEYFIEAFNEEVGKLKPDVIDKSLHESMYAQAPGIIDKVADALDATFPGYKVIGVEEELHEEVDDIDIKLKGYIDLIIQTPDEKYHIIDWKTCSWGWDARKKADKIIGYQLVLYKRFWAKKHNVPLEQIETHFGLLKRTAKKNQVEIFRISTGQKKINNALTLLRHAVINIEKKRVFKNRLSCKYCPFYKTKHCT